MTFDAIWFFLATPLDESICCLRRRGCTVDLMLFLVTNSATTLEIPVSSDSWPPPSESSCFLRKICRLKITWGMKTYSIDVNIYTHACVIYAILAKFLLFHLASNVKKLLKLLILRTFLCFGEDYLSLFQLLLCNFFPFTLKLIFFPLYFENSFFFHLYFETHIPI